MVCSSLFRNWLHRKAHFLGW